MKLKLWRMFCVVAFYLLIGNQSLLAAPDEVQLSLTPESLALAPGEKAEAVIVIKNTSNMALTHLQLSWIAAPGIVVTCEQLSRASLPANSTWVQKIFITKNIDGPMSAKVNFQLQHTRQSKEDHLNVIFRTLEIQHRPIETIDKIATIEIKTALTQLQEHQRGIIYVIIRNITDIPIRIAQVTGNKPDFINLQVLPADSIVTLAAQQAYTYDVVISLKDAIQTGKHLLLFNARLEWERNGQVFRGNLIASHGLETGVIGESEILKLIGVPSFLLLPGFLMVMVFMTIWNRFQQLQISLNATSAKFWLIAITLSLLTAPLYPIIMDIFGTPRNYLAGYGLFDVFLVWFGSLIAASSICLLILGGIAFYKYYQKFRKIPTPYDTPYEILEKLISINQSYPLKQATYKKADDIEQCFVLLEAGDDIWLAPPIGIEFLPGASDEKRRIFNTDMDDVKNWQDLLKRLRQAEDEKVIVVKGWKKLPSLDLPTKRKRASIIDILDQPRHFIDLIE